MAEACLRCLTGPRCWIWLATDSASSGFCAELWMPSLSRAVVGLDITYRGHATCDPNVVIACRREHEESMSTPSSVFQIPTSRPLRATEIPRRYQEQIIPRPASSQLWSFSSLGKPALHADSCRLCCPSNPFLHPGYDVTLRPDSPFNPTTCTILIPNAKPLSRLFEMLVVGALQGLGIFLLHLPTNLFA